MDGIMPPCRLSMQLMEIKHGQKVKWIVYSMQGALELNSNAILI